MIATSPVVLPVGVQLVRGILLNHGCGPSCQGVSRVFEPQVGDVPEIGRAPSRFSGADPYKLQRQIARFGASTVGMPPVWVYEGSDGVLEIINGATRATRIAKLAPGTPIRVEVIGKLRQPRAHHPKVGDRL